MLTLTIDGRSVELSAEDTMFVVDCMHAALSHRGHRFERTRQSAAGVFRISAGATVRSLASGVKTFKAADGSVLTDC
jgi:hypothetical protein